MKTVRYVFSILKQPKDAMVYIERVEKGLELSKEEIDEIKGHLHSEFECRKVK